MSRPGFAKRSIAFLLISLLLLVACGGGGTGDTGDSATSPPGGTEEDTQAAAEAWKLGVPLGFTGALAAYAPTQERGIQLAVDQVNENPPGGREIEILTRDTESDEATAVSIFEELVRRENVHAIIGPTSSANAFAADPIADEAGVPVIAPANTAAGIPDIGECVFRVSAAETEIIPGAIEKAVDEFDPSSAAVIYASSDEFNSTGGTTMEETFEEQGVSVVGTATFATGDTNFQSQLTQLLDDDPDVLGVAAFTAEAIQVVRQARQLGFEGLVLGNKGFSGGAVIEELGEAGGTLVVGAQWHANAETTGNQEFVSDFQSEFDDAPDEFSALAFDAVHLLAAALEAAGSDTNEARDVCEALQGIDELDGVTGHLTFTDNGDVQVGGIALVSRDGADWTVLGA